MPRERSASDHRPLQRWKKGELGTANCEPTASMLMLTALTADLYHVDSCPVYDSLPVASKPAASKRSCQTKRCQRAQPVAGPKQPDVTTPISSTLIDRWQRVTSATARPGQDLLRMTQLLWIQNFKVRQEAICIDCSHLKRSDGADVGAVDRAALRQIAGECGVRCMYARPAFVLAVLPCAAVELAIRDCIDCQILSSVEWQFLFQAVSSPAGQA